MDLAAILCDVRDDRFALTIATIMEVVIY